MTSTDPRTDRTWLRSLPAASLYELRIMTANKILDSADPTTLRMIHETEVLAVINSEVNRRLNPST